MTVGVKKSPFKFYWEEKTLKQNLNSWSISTPFLCLKKNLMNEVLFHFCLFNGF